MEEMPPLSIGVASLLAGVERDETVMGARSWAAINAHDGKIVTKVCGVSFLETSRWLLLSV